MEEPKIMEENNKTICLNSKVDGKQPSLTDRVYDSNGCSTAITTSPFFMGSVLEEPKCEEIKMQQTVRVRKYDLDISKFQHCLKEHKTKSNKEIAKVLNLPITTVEHWFRCDSGFAIPSEDIWLDLKKLLKIDTDEFDKAIMEFEIKPSVFDMGNRAYKTSGLSATLKANGEHFVAEEPIKIKEATKKGYTEAEVGDSINLNYPESQTRRGRVGKGVAQTLDCNCKQGVVEPIALDEQNKCIRTDGTVGTLTTDGSSPKHNNRVIEPSYELSPQMKRYIVAGDNKYKVNENNLQLNRNIACAKITREGSTRADASDYISPDREDNCQLKMGEDLMPYRVRKLTPKECFRLMGVKDEDYDKVAQNQSNSSLYHLAGDSIVCNGMLTALLGQLFEL